MRRVSVDRVGYFRAQDREDIRTQLRLHPKLQNYEEICVTCGEGPVTVVLLVPRGGDLCGMYCTKDCARTDAYGPMFRQGFSIWTLKTWRTRKHWKKHFTCSKARTGPPSRRARRASGTSVR